MAVGSLIVASDYNTIQSKVALVLGTGSGDYGYGQVLSSSQVSVSAKISVLQWNNLRSDLLKARQHQTGADESAGLTQPSTTIKIFDADRAAYNSMADLITTNRLITPPAGQATPEDVATPAVRSAAWNGSIVHTLTVTFSSENARRNFFNTGSEFRFTASRSDSPSDPTVVTAPAGTKDYSWSQLLGTNTTLFPSGMGTIKFNHNSTTVTGSGSPSSSIGFFQLTGSDQTIFIKNATLYTPNRYYINARLAGTTQIVFSIVFEDSATSAPNPNPPWDIDENVTGTLTSTVKVYRASGSNVSVPLPTGSSSGL